VMAAIMIGLNLFYLLNSRGDGVSYIAHLGGALTGYLYLKRAWRIGEFYRELRWKIKRRRFKVMSPGNHDEYLH
jgi:membrane associated rhomboid family serine protease